MIGAIVMRWRSSTVGVVAVATVLASCAGDPVTPEGAVTAPAGSVLPALRAVAELGYPRDLLDRGRVNIVLTRSGDESFVLLEHQLRIEGFEAAPAEERRIVVPANGQRVAIQGIFGDVVDCAVAPPLAASLDVRFTIGDDPTVQDASIELDDTATLADILARFCTARRVLAEHDISLGAPRLEGETLALDLMVRRRSGSATLAIDAIQGTVLFGVESPYERGSPERALDGAVDELVLPLTFVVNRCDPHAVAETTKKTGLTLWIAVDGADPQPVDIDVAPIGGDLEEILGRCKARAGR